MSNSSSFSSRSYESEFSSYTTVTTMTEVSVEEGNDGKGSQNPLRKGGKLGKLEGENVKGERSREFYYVFSGAFLCLFSFSILSVALVFLTITFLPMETAFSTNVSNHTEGSYVLFQNDEIRGIVHTEEDVNTMNRVVKREEMSFYPIQSSYDDEITNVFQCSYECMNDYELIKKRRNVQYRSVRTLPTLIFVASVVFFEVKRSTEVAESLAYKWIEENDENCYVMEDSLSCEVILQEKKSWICSGNCLLEDINDNEGRTDLLMTLYCGSVDSELEETRIKAWERFQNDCVRFYEGALIETKSENVKCEKLLLSDKGYITPEQDCFEDYVDEERVI